MMAVAEPPFAKMLASADIRSPHFPVYSNTTAGLYPSDPEAIRSLLTRHLTQPVRWREQIEAMYDAGTRVFIEAGSGRGLSQLVGDILADRPHAAIACDAPGDHGVRRFLMALAQLAVAGAPVETGWLFDKRATVLDEGALSKRSGWIVNGHLVRTADGDVVPGGLLPASSPPPTIGSEGTTGGVVSEVTDAASWPHDGVVVEYLRSVRETMEAQRDVVMRYLEGPTDAAGVAPRVELADDADADSEAKDHGPDGEPPVAVGDGDDFMGLLLDLVSERTGYPLDMLGPDLDLEADLGIDSIKRLEIIGDLADRVGIGTGSGTMAELDDSVVEELVGQQSLRAVVTWLEANLGRLDPPRSTGGDAMSTERLSLPPQPAESEVPARSVRAVFRTVPAPITVGSEATLSGSSFVVVDDGSGVAQLVLTRIEALGAHARVVDRAPVGHGDDCGVDGLVHLGLSVPLGESAADVYERVQPLAMSGARWLVAVTGLGGSSGRQPRSGMATEPRRGGSIALGGAGVAGMWRALARELPLAHVRAIDFDLTERREAIADAIIDEMRAPGGPVVVGYQQGRRVTVAPVEEELAVRRDGRHDGARRWPLDPDSVVLLTGGARGITAQLAICLARSTGCAVELVGRSPLPEATESADLASALDAGAVRRVLTARGMNRATAIEAECASVLAAREIRATLSDLESAGVLATYHAADVRDAVGLVAVVDDVYARHGRLDGIVHGAGVIEDRLLADKTPHSFRRVFDTKVAGAATLLDALRDDRAFVVLYSSVSGAFGVRGQVDYGAANDALATMAWTLAARRPTGSGPVVAVDWGPWAGAGMVPAQLERAYALRGIGLLDVDDALVRLVDELVAPTSEPGIVVARARMASFQSDSAGRLPSEPLSGQAECRPDRAFPAARGRHSREDDPPGGRVLLLAAPDADGLLAQLDSVDLSGDHRMSPPAVDAGRVRLAMVDADEARISLARRIVLAGRPCRGRKDLWFSPDGLVTEGGKLAYIFPGIEPNQVPEVEEVARHFGWPPPPRFGDSVLERQSRDMLWAGGILDAAMDRLGVRPDLIAGHSLGEWSGMVASGMVAGAIVDELSHGLLPAPLQVPDVVYLLVSAGVGTAASVAGGLPSVRVSHDNCIHQSVLCGDPLGIREAGRRLRERGVLCHELPIRSGFHSPAFEPFLAPLRHTLGRIDFQPPSVPLWSATTVAPYPTGADRARELSVRHVVEPVRFRELTDALYGAGARVFLQMGFGSTPSFIDDTLRSHSVATVSAGSRKHPGMAQLLRAATGLWVEGVHVEFAALGPGHDDRDSMAVKPFLPPKADGQYPLPSTSSPGPGLQGVRAVQGSAGSWQRPWVQGGLPSPTSQADRSSMASRPGAVGTRRGGGGVPGGPPSAVDRLGPPRATRWVVSGKTDPYLLDHSLLRQPEGWPSMADRFPVAPMTTMIEVMGKAAREVAPHLVVVGYERVRALRWLTVEPPSDVTIRARLQLPGSTSGEVQVDSHPDLHPTTRVTVDIEGHASAIVVLARDFMSPPPGRLAPSADEQPLDLTASAMYRDVMFHGPAFQAVVQLKGEDPNGIRGVLANLPAPGALLDGAGQLVGLWTTRWNNRDRFNIPVSIESVRLYGPPPGREVPVPCTVRVSKCHDRSVRANVELEADGRLWARIDGWENRRLATDAVGWSVLNDPASRVLSEEIVMGEPAIRVQLVRERWTNSASRDLIMRRYLSETERTDYDSHHLRGQRTFLLGRIAAKDAVRRWCWSSGGGPMFPGEVRIANRPDGRPTVVAPAERSLNLSISHTEWIGAAAVSSTEEVGVDIERIRAHKPTVINAALNKGEQHRRPDGLESDEWVTRVWTAKEAVAKARGTGLEGRPLSYEVESTHEDTLEVRDPSGLRWTVATHRRDAYVVAVATKPHGRST